MRFLTRLASTIRYLALAAATAGALATAASADDAPTITVGQTFIAAGLDPAEGSAGWALVSHGVAEQLFTVSREGRVVPLLAEAASRDDDTNWTVTLRAGRLFSDGTPVNAESVAAALNRTGENNPAARATAGRLTFSALDDKTLKVATERPTPVLPAVLAEWAFPIYRETQDGMVFTGPYAVEHFEPGSRLDLVANAHYPDANARPNVIIRRIADGQSLALAFKAGEVDLAFHLPVETLPMFANDPDLAVKSFAVGYQYMMWINTQRPGLEDVRVRKAINLAINRDDLAKAARGGVPATGAYAEVYPFAATGEITSDMAAAEALLDEAGWVRGADGRRAKDSVPLELVLWAYPQRPDLITFQPVVRAALEEIGIGVTTQVTENPSDEARKGAFDLFLWAQHTAPSGDPGQYLGLFLASSGGNNYVGWSNAEFDAIVERLGQVSEPAERNELAREAQAIIAGDAPVAFLLSPEWHVGLSKRVADYEPWGSDYYVIRSDLQVSEH